MTDTTIYALLKTDPQHAMEHIITQYTGLLWSVASLWLQEPEDIKDCVNETFSEFYFHHDRYDPEKGSLKAYLSVIAKRIAMRQHADLLRCSDAENLSLPGNPFQQAEQRDELDAALRSLDPLDERIIRMKYYGGMTAKEIAAHLNLPYETVKKRHQRGLKKMKKALTMGLVIAALAALLAACSYVVLRYFGILPGYGVSTDPQSHFFLLADSDTMHTERFDLTVTEAWWNAGVLIVNAELQFTDAEANFNPQPQADGTTQMMFAPVVPSVTVKAGADDWIHLKTIVLDSDADVATQVRYVFKGTLTDERTDTLELFLSSEGGKLSMVLPRNDSELTPDEAGCYSLMDDGGLLAIPRLENGELIVSIYPLNMGQYQTNVGLTTGFWDGFGASFAPVTVTTEDGQVLTGRPVNYNPYSYTAYLDWNFGSALPGKYVLTVPYVYQTVANNQVLEWELLLPEDPTDLMLEAEVPGGSITLGQLAPTEYAERVFCGEEARIFPQEEYGAYRWWTLEAEWYTDDPTRMMTMVTPSLSFANSPIQLQNGFYADTGIVSRSRDIVDETGTLISELDAYVLYTNDPNAAMVLRLDTANICYRWNQEFRLTFTISE